MVSESDDSVATLYGPASVFFGIAALMAAVFAAFIGVGVPVLAGSLALTFALLGIGSGRNRRQCIVGLITGSVGALVPLALALA
ncbi:hypothetical protein ACFVIM_13650 [Streptomyces sp. NPDC057638]|uniref:hypothetical protein n=1 Tax=Streptomyces sp. NPDC057638 TaxID=3346190 RepID=UPI0036D14AFC